MNLAEVEAALAAAGFPAAAEEARILNAAADGIDASRGDLVARRVDGEPLEWLTGSVNFLRSVVRIQPGIYVPRPQSEIVAERAIERLPHGGTAVDLATGCGAIAVAMADARPGARIVATDVDPHSCRCAATNGVDALCGDLGRPLPTDLYGEVDVVVAVVPYVPTEALLFLPRDVRRHEPLLALDGGPGGLDLLKRAVEWGAVLLAPGGSLVLELGGSQDSALEPFLAAAGLEPVDRLVDEDGDLRGVEAVRRG